ncbi:MAG: hypothetical protein U9Q69_02040 [Nanoarchaeota archaeon]|nr:hypothetical protein [Nanoarchaeota archaeon]
MNKKAQYDFGRKTIYYIIVAIFLTVMFIYLNIGFARFDFRVIQTTNKLAGEILAAEIAISPECFSFTDKDTGRAYPGIIDKGLFETGILRESCARYYQDRIIVYLVSEKNPKYEYFSSKWNQVMKAGFDEQLKNLKFVGKDNLPEPIYYFKNVIVKDGDKKNKGVLIIGYEEK